MEDFDAYRSHDQQAAECPGRGAIPGRGPQSQSTRPRPCADRAARCPRQRPQGPGAEGWRRRRQAARRIEPVPRRPAQRRPVRRQREHEPGSGTAVQPRRSRGPGAWRSVHRQRAGAARRAGDEPVDHQGVDPGRAQPQVAGRGHRQSARRSGGGRRRRRGEPRGARQVHARSHRARHRGQARPGDRTRRRDPPHHPGAAAAHQEQPGADRRTRGGQDGDRRGPGPADHQRRGAGRAQGQARAVARHGRAACRRQVPR